MAAPAAPEEAPEDPQDDGIAAKAKAVVSAGKDSLHNKAMQFAEAQGITVTNAEMKVYIQNSIDQAVKESNGYAKKLIADYAAGTPQADDITLVVLRARPGNAVQV